MIKLFQAWRGAKTLRAWFAAGGKCVPHYQTLNRASVCVDCPHNKRGNIADFITRFLARRITSRMPKIYGYQMARIFTCQKCGCAISLLTRTPIGVIAMHKPLDEWEELPKFCWQKKEFEQ